MEMHKVSYTVSRTGSKLFDQVMINAAKEICSQLAGITCETTDREIRITGALNDEDFARYQAFMFGGDELLDETN